MHPPIDFYLRQEKKRLETHQSIFLKTVQKGMEPKKHVYLIVGDPRTGKTTIGRAASLSVFAKMIDTDSYNEDNVLDETKKEILSFLEERHCYLLFIIIGRHRQKNEVIINQTKELVENNTHLSICRTERI